MPELTDLYTTQDWLEYVYGSDLLSENRSSLYSDVLDGGLPFRFPFTGTSFSRRTGKGIPFYRIVQAIDALMEVDGDLPSYYKEKSFGGKINFRGFNYVVDLSGLPINKIPPLYNFDFDQMTILEFCQEISDIISHDLFISLLPVINHPACQRYCADAF